MLRILVVNGKGGCGKTTVATNLAGAYACRGLDVALVDHDSQASTTQWLQQRPRELPKIHLIEAHQRTTMYRTRSFEQRLLVDAQHIIIDTPSAVGDTELDTLLRRIDAIVVPMLPSSIDIRAGTRFIAQLLTHRVYKARPVPVAVVANRVRRNTSTHNQLMRFLDCLEVPAVATFSDASIYTKLAEEGTTLFDEVRASVRELPEWRKLLDWIDDAVEYKASTRGPIAAPRSLTVSGAAATA